MTSDRMVHFRVFAPEFMDAVTNRWEFRDSGLEVRPDEASGGLLGEFVEAHGAWIVTWLGPGEYAQHGRLALSLDPDIGERWNRRPKNLRRSL